MMPKFYSASDVNFEDRGGTSTWLTSCQYLLKFIWGCLGFFIPYAHSAERALCKGMKTTFLLGYLLCRWLANIVLSALATALSVAESNADDTQREVLFETDDHSNDTVKYPEMTTKILSTTPYSVEGYRQKRTANYDSYHPMYDGLRGGFWELKIVQISTAILALTTILLIVKLTLLWCSSLADIYMVRSALPLLPTAVVTPKGWRWETELGMQAVTGPLTSLEDPPEVDTMHQEPAEAPTDISDPLPRRDIVTAWIHQSEDPSPSSSPSPSPTPSPSPSPSRASSHEWSLPGWWHVNPQGGPVSSDPSSTTGSPSVACFKTKSVPDLRSLR